MDAGLRAVARELALWCAAVLATFAAVAGLAVASAHVSGCATSPEERRANVVRYVRDGCRFVLAVTEGGGLVVRDESHPHSGHAPEGAVHVVPAK